MKIIPCVRFRNNSKEEQLAKVWSEQYEVVKEVRHYRDDGAKEELMDVICAAVTMLHCQYEMSLADIDELAERINEKNRQRGYHDEVL